MLRSVAERELLNSGEFVGCIVVLGLFGLSSQERRGGEAGAW